MKDQKKDVTLRLIRCFSSEKKLIIRLFFSVILGTVAGVVAPGLQSKAVDIIAGTREGVLRSVLVSMCAVYAVYFLFRLSQGILAASISQNMSARLREELFSRVMDLPVEYTDRHRTGDIMSIMTNDIENISATAAQAMPSLIGGVFTLIGTLAAMFWYSWQLTLLSCSTVILTVIVTKTMSKRIRKHSR